jgi:hypothetical protein
MWENRKWGRVITSAVGKEQGSVPDWVITGRKKQARRTIQSSLKGICLDGEPMKGQTETSKMWDGVLDLAATRTGGDSAGRYELHRCLLSPG